MFDWSRQEVEATVIDYFEMLAAELSGVPYNKAEHRRRLLEQLKGRSEASIEFKHANISAILIDIGFPYIAGYKPRSNYQNLLSDVVLERLNASRQLRDIAQADVDQPTVIPEVDDILSILMAPPSPHARERVASEPHLKRVLPAMNYLEREARNSSLGLAGERLVMIYEHARLIRAGKKDLAEKVEHVSQARGDGEGYDILSFEESGEERLVEVKTTKYGQETPFFVSRHELSVSDARFGQYRLYRVFQFKVSPRLYILAGALSKTCTLAPASYVAAPRFTAQDG